MLILGTSKKFWPRFVGPGKVNGQYRRVVGRRRLLATGGLALWLEMGVYIWRSVRHIGCLWSAFEAFPATLLVYALINVGGRMYVPLMWSVVCLETTLTIHLTNFPKVNNLSDSRG